MNKTSNYNANLHKLPVTLIFAFIIHFSNLYFSSIKFWFKYESIEKNHNFTD
jgi:hypothetical protein